MDIRDVSVYFDNDEIYDGYTDVFLFLAQLTSFDQSQIDGSFIRRRTISFGVDIVIPNHRVIQAYNGHWLLGTPLTDGFQSVAVRLTTSAKFCTGLYGISDVLSYIKGIPTTRELYGHVRYLKGTSDTESTSEYQSSYEAAFSVNEKGFIGSLILRGSEVYVCRNQYEDPTGFTLVECDMIAEADDPHTGLKQVEIKGTYDPYEQKEGVSRLVPALMFDRYQLYERFSDAEQDNKPGDKNLLMDPVDESQVASNFTIDGREWTKLDTVPYGNATLVHIRRV